MGPENSKSFKSILAIVLSLSLLAPAGWTAERTESEGRTEQTASAADRTDAGSAQPLSAEELTELSERAEEPGPEVEGGALSNLHLTYAVIAIATAIIVLIAVK